MSAREPTRRDLASSQGALRVAPSLVSAASALKPNHARAHAGTALSPRDWEELLARELGCPVEVRYGRARRSVVRVERRSRSASAVSGRRALVVHLNAMFESAPAEVQQALASWMRSGRRARRACTLLDEWIDLGLERLHRERPIAISLRTRGRAHDLEPLAEELRAEEFDGVFEADLHWPRITWGKLGPSGSRRSLRLGSFDYSSRVVRIHPVLDQHAVPSWFVRYVLFHELLHAALGDRKRVRGRRMHHGPEFQRREQAYRDSERALAWEKEHISALVTSARTGRALDEIEARSRKRRPARAEPRRRSWIQRLLF